MSEDVYHNAHIARQQGAIYNRDVVDKQIRALLFHAAIFVTWLISSHFLVSLFLYLGGAMWFAGGIVARYIPNERESIIRNTQRFILSFSALLGYSIILKIITGIPEMEWERALGISSADVVASNAYHYLRMLFQIFMIGIPISFFAYLGTAIFSYRSSVDVGERTKQFIRTGRQRTREDRRITRQQMAAMHAQDDWPNDGPKEPKHPIRV